MMPCYEMIRHATPDLYTLIESEPAQGRTPRCAASFAHITGVCQLLEAKISAY